MRILPHCSTTPAAVADVLERLLEASSAEVLIYTNTDIALMPHFYLSVAKLSSAGVDAAVINRRTIPLSEIPAQATLPDLYPMVGVSHPGYDCFVFARGYTDRFVLEKVCIGVPGIGRAPYYNLQSST